MYQRRNQIQELCICMIDGVCVACAFFFAGILRLGSWQQFAARTNISLSLVGILFVHIASYYVIKMYEDIYRRGPLREIWKVFEYDLLLLLGSTLYIFFTKNIMEISRLMMLIFVPINGLMVYCCHHIIKKLHKSSRFFKDTDSRLLLITDSLSLEKAVEKLREPSNWKYHIQGAVVIDKDMVGQTVAGIPVVAGLEDYLDYTTVNVVDEAFIFLKDLPKWSDEMKEIILELEQTGIVVELNVDVFDFGSKDSRSVYRLGNCQVMAFSSRLFDYRLLLMKRLMDIVGAIIGLALTGVMSVCLAPVLLLESPGPLIFAQERVGKNGRVFRFYKFRSMYRDAEERKAELMAQNEMQGGMFKMTNDPRITKVGKFIRKTSIDELPQFWNVLKGDMSLVGTRPPTVDEYQQYTNRQKRRISFRPGITGLWQISGRSNIKEFDEVVKLDLEYIDNWSLGLDIKIILKTIVAVCGGIGAR